MIRLVMDLYEAFNPFERPKNVKRKKTRWSGDDHYTGKDEPAAKKRKSTALIQFHGSLMRVENQSKKKNRWGAQVRTKLTVDDLNQFQERVEVLTSVSRKLMFVKCLPEPDDPYLKLPEPSPVYDANGKRTNTLDIRYREKLEKDKNILIYQLLQLNPTYTAPSSYKPPPFEHIMWLPVKEYPDTNFIGAIIGPRGNTQKRLEKESGCKIAIRGKGTEKNLIRMVMNPFTGDMEEATHHIYVTAPNEEKLEKAIELLTPLMKPQSELVRMEQMKELALMNGTYRFDMRCKECGEMGHKDIHCPQKKNTYFACIQCEKCGDVSHVTGDCPQRATVEVNKKELDAEYQQFIAEIKGEDPEEAKNRFEKEQKAKEDRKMRETKFISQKHKKAITLMKPSEDTIIVPYKE